MYFEGFFIAIMLRCIFPSFRNLKNTIPAVQAIDTQTLIGFVLAFIFTIPFMAIHTSKLRHCELSLTLLQPAR